MPVVHGKLKYSDGLVRFERDQFRSLPRAEELRRIQFSSARNPFSSAENSILSARNSVSSARGSGSNTRSPLPNARDSVTNTRNSVSNARFFGNFADESSNGFKPISPWPTNTAR